MLWICHKGPVEGIWVFRAPSINTKGFQTPKQRLRQELLLPDGYPQEEGSVTAPRGVMCSENGEPERTSQHRGKPPISLNTPWGKHTEHMTAVNQSAWAWPQFLISLIRKAVHSYLDSQLTSFPILVSQASEILLHSHKQQKRVNDQEGDEDTEWFGGRSAKPVSEETHMDACQGWALSRKDPRHFGHRNKHQTHWRKEVAEKGRQEEPFWNCRSSQHGYDADFNRLRELLRGDTVRGSLSEANREHLHLQRASLPFPALLRSFANWPLFKVETCPQAWGLTYPHPCCFPPYFTFSHNYVMHLFCILPPPTSH